MAMSSGSELDLAKLDCFCDCQKIGNRVSPVAMAMKIPLVDLDVHGQLAKSASAKTRICGPKPCETAPTVTKSMMQFNDEMALSNCLSSHLDQRLAFLKLTFQR